MFRSYNLVRVTKRSSFVHVNAKKYWHGTEPLKMIPYGISSWSFMKDNKKFYVDKTAHIKKLEENGHFNKLLRPRRFGKTLFCDQLHLYYDIGYNKKFDRFYKETAIGSSPSDSHNKYFIIRLKFNEINADADDVANHFQDYLNLKLRDFSVRYLHDSQPEQLPEIEVNTDDYTATLRSMFDIVKSTQHKVYLIIDDYDSILSNVILSNPHATLEADEHVRSRVMERERVLDTFSRQIKCGVDEGIIERIFITATSPLTTTNSMSEGGVSDGAAFITGDCVKDISHDIEFESLLGFTENDLRRVLPYVIPSTADYEHNISLMRDYYNGYRFHPLQHTPLFNPQLCLFYLQELQQQSVSPAIVLGQQLHNPYSAKMNMLLEEKVVSFIVQQYMWHHHHSSEHHNETVECRAGQAETGTEMKRKADDSDGHRSMQKQFMSSAYPLIYFAEGHFQLDQIDSHITAGDLLGADRRPEALVSLAYHYGILTHEELPAVSGGRKHTTDVKTTVRTGADMLSGLRGVAESAGGVTLVSSNYVNRDLFMDTLVKQLPRSYPAFNQLLMSYVRETDTKLKQELLAELGRMSVVSCTHSAGAAGGGRIETPSGGVLRQTVKEVTTTEEESRSEQWTDFVDDENTDNAVNTYKQSKKQRVEAPVTSTETRLNGAEEQRAEIKAPVTGPTALLGRIVDDLACELKYKRWKYPSGKSAADERKTN